MTRFDTLCFQTDAWAMADRHGVTLSLVVHGEAVAQPRHRVRRVGPSRMIFYDPAATCKRKYKRSIDRSLVAIGVSERPVFAANGQLTVDVTFNVLNANKDVDNMLKYVLDALQGLIYGNDREIFEVHAKKIVSNSEFTEITVSL